MVLLIDVEKKSTGKYIVDVETTDNRSFCCCIQEKSTICIKAEWQRCMEIRFTIIISKWANAHFFCTVIPDMPTIKLEWNSKMHWKRLCIILFSKQFTVLYNFVCKYYGHVWSKLHYKFVIWNYIGKFEMWNILNVVITVHQLRLDSI